MDLEHQAEIWPIQPKGGGGGGEGGEGDLAQVELTDT